MKNIFTNKRLIWYLILLLLLCCFLFFKIFKMNNQYHVWKGHYDYMDKDNKTMQSWMTVNMLHNYFNKDYKTIFNILNLENNLSNRRMTIDEYCRVKNVDCLEILTKLKND